MNISSSFKPGNECELIRVSSQKSDAKIIEELSMLDEEHFPLPWAKKTWLELDFKKYLVLGLMYKNKIIAFSVCLLIFEDKTCHLLKTLSLPGFRKLGAAQHVLTSLKALCQEVGLNKIYLEVESSNDKAIKLYKKIGFKNIHLSRNYYGHTRDAFIMTYIL